MAKIVSTKFGDRRLVYLPPINLTKGNKTAKVETIETGRQVPERYGNARAVSVVPKEYAYKDRSVRGKNPWLGAPVRSTLEGNIVSEQPRNICDQVFQQLYQQASTNTMANYGQGQYPVLPPIDEPHYMQYTNAGLQPMTQQQPIIQQQPQPLPQISQAVQPQQQLPQQQLPQQQLPQQQVAGNAQSNPNERHIYHGPDGEVLPGPPSCCQREERTIQQDFAFEGVLHFGRLTTINLMESASGFPKIPDFLIKDLLEKYGQYETTVVRVVSRLGRCFVHATPQVRENFPIQPEYVPVYLRGDEEFDYDNFMAEYNQRNPADNASRRPPWRYGILPRQREREIVHKRKRLDSPDVRPGTYDAPSNYRWRKDDERYRPTDRRTDTRTNPSRADSWTYRAGSRGALPTRADIKPIEKLDRRYRKY